MGFSNHVSGQKAQVASNHHKQNLLSQNPVLAASLTKQTVFNGQTLIGSFELQINDN